MSMAHEVKYSDDRPVIKQFDRPNNLAMLEMAMLTKARHWEYEKEWRLISYSAGHGLIKFRPKHLTGIIFGARTSTAAIEKVQSILERRVDPISLFQAHVSRTKFDILIKPTTFIA